VIIFYKVSASYKMDESNNKRKTNELHIIDLPDGLLVGISSYLAKPSVSLFAIAVNTQSKETSKAILSAINWNVLDFSDIEKSLAAKLLDDDIDKILRSIDAVNNLQILKLAGCVNIAGRGLNVLRASTTIEQIDMSLVGIHEVPVIDPEPSLLGDIVIPILDSIISRGRESSLKQLELPKKWRNVEVETVSHPGYNELREYVSPWLRQFLERYNDYLTNQRYVCSKCNLILPGSKWINRYRERENDEDAFDRYGTQIFTCSLCVNHFCHDDVCMHDNGQQKHSGWCSKCEKYYCKSCSAMTKCDQCCKHFCKCTDMKVCIGGCREAGGRSKTLCENCSSSCSFCKKITLCYSCDEHWDCLRNCSECKQLACHSCRVHHICPVGASV